MWVCGEAAATCPSHTGKTKMSGASSLCWACRAARPLHVTPGRALHPSPVGPGEAPLLCAAWHVF